MSSENYNKPLIERFKAGDSHAFDEIYLIYCDKLFGFSMGLLKDKDSAEEMVQEVFIRLWEKRHQVNIDMNFDNYLITITHNSIKKIFRRRLTELKVREQLALNSLQNDNNLENELIYSELLCIAEDSIEKLPPKRKQVYKMSRQEGLRIKEIAGKLEISTRTVECHLSKALKFLKQEMKDLNLIEIDKINQ